MTGHGTATPACSPGVPDESWAPLARSTREALRLLGYGIEPRCLPGEAEACGGTFTEHAAAQLAALRAVTDHHAAHLGPEWFELLGAVYAKASAEVSHW